MIRKNRTAYKSIGEVAKILDLVNKKKKHFKYTYNSFLGKRIQAN